METMVCSRCLKSSLDVDFPRSSSLGKWMSMCRLCSRAYQKQWHKDHPGYSTRQSKKWKKEHPAETRAASRRYQDKKRTPEQNEALYKKQSRSISEKRTDAAYGLLANRKKQLDKKRSSGKMAAFAEEKKQYRQRLRLNIDCVYFMQTHITKSIKIGYTINHPRLRVDSMKTGCPEDLTIIATIMGGRELEKFLHHRFKHLRIHGEWFTPGADLLEYIEANATLWDDGTNSSAAYDQVIASTARDSI